jgi:hypothetical protein
MPIYQIQCKVCGTHFSVSGPNDKVPEHDPNGKIIKTNDRIRPCRGSGIAGRLVR